MSKRRCTWVSLVVLSIAALLFMSGCGGSGSSSQTQQPAVAKAAVSGTVSFPSLNSLVGKQAGLPAVKSLAAPTVELRDLSGKVVATVQATGTGTTVDPYAYSFANLDTADYVVKATSADGKIVKALIDKSSLGTALSRDVDTISTTTIIVAEKKLNVALGTIGEKVSAAVTTDKIATDVNPVALEGSIKTAVNTVQYSAASATQAAVDLVNLVNVVTATVNNKIDTSLFIAGTANLPTGVTTTQYTLADVATGGSAQTAAAVQASVSQTLTTAVTSYVPPAANTVYYISKVYDYNTTSTGTPVAGATVSTIGLATEVSTVTDVNGLFILAGIPQNASFSVRMSKPASGNVDAYSNTFSMTTSIDSSDRPYALWSPAKLTSWGNVTGNGVIRSKVVASTDLVNGILGGVVVTATDKSDGTVYPVKYYDTNGAVSSTLSSTNSANGNYLVVNVPAGRVVEVTAVKSGYTFNTRTFTTHADAVCMARIVGTVASTTASALKASLMSGWYEIRQENVYNQAMGTNTNYYSVERIALAADGLTMTSANTLYFDRVSKTWTTSVPSGFPTSTSNDYTLSTGGTWVSDNGPQGYSLVFNADGTARMTSPASGEVMDISISTVSLAGQAVSAGDLDGAPLRAAATAYPADATRYNITISSSVDSYQLWDSYSQLSTLASVPAAFAESSPTGSSVWIESPSRTEYFYGKFVDGSTTSVNIYRNSNTGQSVPQLIGTATASTVTVLGQQVLEVSVPSALRSTYGLNNPIFAVVNGVVMQGVHSFAGVDPNRGGTMLNDVAINHVVANIDTALAKSVVGKKLSKAILGW